MPRMNIAEYERALEARLRGAMAGVSPLAVIRMFRGVEAEELASRTGMPLARIQGVEEGRLAFTDDELDAVAAALGVPFDLLVD